LKHDLFRSDFRVRVSGEPGSERKLCKAKGVNAADPFALAPFLKENKDAAFYDGKVKSAKYFIKNVLPEVDAVVKAIKSEDLSMMEIADEGF